MKHLQLNPTSILLIKSHSLGIGDLLRSSAAWKSLRLTWPQAKLNLVFLSKHQGYATEEIIKHHHLLNDAFFITIRQGTPHDKLAKTIEFKKVLINLLSVCAQTKPDLIIDFEASGLRTSWLTLVCSKLTGAKSLGIAQFLGRRFFYDIASASVNSYIKSNKLKKPFDYSWRDYVALAALGVNRNNQPIELEVQPAGVNAKERLKNVLPANRMTIGLNIGCGTPDALPRRPNLSILVEALGRLNFIGSLSIVLTGAKNEHEINTSFISLYHETWGHTDHIFNWAGQASISELTGVIDATNLFISSDSGPYHMAIALRKPTLVLFNYPELSAFHSVSWCQQLISPYTSDDIQAAIQKLWLLNAPCKQINY